MSGAENAQVEIFDMAGKVMFTAPVSGEGAVAISSLNAGFYIAKVGNAVCKFVK
ncbi:MAG: T9SS type A sorting domain-containing protein [Muribaculaceae bacterium]